MSTKKLQILGSLGSNLELDTTLAQEGKAADAKSVGDAIENLNTLVGDTSVSTQITDALNDINEVPTSTTDDNGKFLCVVNGVATWTAIPNAEEATFGV